MPPSWAPRPAQRQAKATGKKGRGYYAPYAPYYVVAAPRPVYYAPAPVYYAPRPPPVVVYPAPVAYAPAYYSPPGISLGVNLPLR